MSAEQQREVVWVRETVGDLTRARVLEGLWAEVTDDMGPMSDGADWIVSVRRISKWFDGRKVNGGNGFQIEVSEVVEADRIPTEPEPEPEPVAPGGPRPLTLDEIRADLGVMTGAWD